MAKDVARVILATERTALDRWGKGDPDGFLEISDQDVVYFDPFQPHRVDGLAALKAMYEELRGKIRIERDEIVDPRVQAYGDIAVLSSASIPTEARARYAGIRQKCTGKAKTAGESSIATGRSPCPDWPAESQCS